jgi:hypothetical protein
VGPRYTKNKNNKLRLVGDASSWSCLLYDVVGGKIGKTALIFNNGNTQNCALHIFLRFSKLKIVSNVSSVKGMVADVKLLSSLPVQLLQIFLKVVQNLQFVRD